MDDFGGFLIGLTMIAIIALVAIWVAYALISLLRQKRPASAHEITDQRYARGELSEEDYWRVKANLESETSRE